MPDVTARQGTTITVTLTEVDGGTQISVIDQGPGIDEAHRQSITEPFRRLDQRYLAVVAGSGIVQRILQLHHGKLTLENGAQGGHRQLLATQTLE